MRYGGAAIWVGVALYGCAPDAVSPDSTSQSDLAVKQRNAMATHRIEVGQSTFEVLGVMKIGSNRFSAWDMKGGESPWLRYIFEVCKVQPIGHVGRGTSSNSRRFDAISKPIHVLVTEKRTGHGLMDTWTEFKLIGANGREIDPSPNAALLSQLVKASISPEAMAEIRRPKHLLQLFILPESAVGESNGLVVESRTRTWSADLRAPDVGLTVQADGEPVRIKEIRETSIGNSNSTEVVFEYLGAGELKHLHVRTYGHKSEQDMLAPSPLSASSEQKSLTPLNREVAVRLPVPLNRIRALEFTRKIKERHPLPPVPLKPKS